MSIPDFVRDDLKRMELDLGDHQIELLGRYLDLLLDANTRVNLTAVKERDAAWRRLILDSLTLVPGLGDLPADAKVIDVGTGGGLPGVPLAIALPGVRFTLLDATGKKVRFLQECVETLGLPNATPLQGRAEDLGHDKSHRQRYDAAVTRAVGSVAEVMEYCAPLVREGGHILIVKGAKAEEELAAASDALTILGAGEVALIEGYPEGFDSELTIVSVIKDRPTPKTYPRKPGVPRSSPL